MGTPRGRAQTLRLSENSMVATRGSMGACHLQSAYPRGGVLDLQKACSLHWLLSCIPTPNVSRSRASPQVSGHGPDMVRTVGKLTAHAYHAGAARQPLL